MRISTSQVFNIANIGMRDAQSAVARTQEQISSGKRVLSPADDPVAATQILKLNEELARLEQYKKNMDVAENILNLEEVAIDGVVNLLHRMKALTVNAGNTGVLTASDYQPLAAEVESRLEELLGLHNTRNNSGQYIFAGHQGATQPFVNDGGGNYRYQGDEGQLRLQASGSVSVAVSDSGRRLFVDIPSGHNTFYTQASESNKAVPPARISAGQVVDQEAFDALYPRDLVIRFNDPGDLSPPGQNFSVLEKETGRVVQANQPYTSGDPIEVAGVRVIITGSPSPGQPSSPGSLAFAFGGAVDFSLAPSTVNVTVAGRTETLVLDQPVNNINDLVNALTATTETVAGSGAGDNAERLARLGVEVTPAGLSVPGGWNLRVSAGDVATDTVMGFATTGMGTQSNNGQVGAPGDSFSIDSTDKEGLLTSLSRLARAMRQVEDTPESKAELGAVVARTLTNLDNALTHVVSVQGEVGARLNTLESARELNADSKLYTQKVLTQLESLDVAEAATRLEMESFILSAAQQSFIKVSNLTLFNFLR